MTAQSTIQRGDRTWVLLLAFAALLLFCIDLGGIPLRDWDEGTVAQVAREISRSTLVGWLHPQLFDQPYLNKPPFLHSLIAIAYRIWGVHTWTARLPGAFFTACSVPMLFLLGREIFPTRLFALSGASVYLTLLPVVRHGRLAMLDGTVAFFFIVLLWAVLKARRVQGWYALAGLSFSLMCLTKGILGGLLLAIALLFMLWEDPKQLRSPYLWSCLFLGVLPVFGWYLLQWQYYGQQFLDITLLNQNFERIWESVDDHQGPPWYYLLELAKYCWPWLVFWPWGLGLTLRSRHHTWAKLLLVWTVGYFLAISVMGTKLPWYIFPLYPAIAMTIGVALTAAWNRHRHWNGRSLSLKRIPLAWSSLLFLFALGGVVGLVYASPFGGEPSGALALTFLTIAVATGLAGWFAIRQQTRFVPVLLSGLYVALLFFVMSDHWVWELGESFPVIPVANLVNQNTLPGQDVYLEYGYSRPSLNFYSDRRIVAQSRQNLLTQWQQVETTYCLVQDTSPYQNEQTAFKDLGRVEGWHLIVNQPYGIRIE